MARRAFILGGTGQIGRAVAEHFLDQDWDVTISHRGSSKIPVSLIEKDVTVVKVSREEAGELSRALGYGTDVLIDTAAYDANHAQQLLDVQSNVSNEAHAG